MVDCAHGLGLGFAQAARAEPDLDRRMALDAPLRGVAADAGRLPVRADAAVLPKLEGLLAKAAKARPSAAAALRVRPPLPPPAKTRFLGSAAPSLTLGVLSRPRPPPHASG